MRELREYSASVFRIFSVSFLVMGFNVVAGGFFTAVERPKSALVISMGRGVIIIGFALVISVALAGGPGIWWAPTVSELLCLLVTMTLMYRYGKREMGSGGV